jgi:hypothetical protein
MTDYLTYQHKTKLAYTSKLGLFSEQAYYNVS